MPFVFGAVPSPRGQQADGGQIRLRGPHGRSKMGGGTNERPTESGFWIGVQKQNQQSVAAAFLHPTAAQSGNWQVSLSVKIALMHLTDVREGAI